MVRLDHRIVIERGTRHNTLSLSCRDCTWSKDSVPPTQVGRLQADHLGIALAKGPLANLPPLSYVELEALDAALNEALDRHLGMKPSTDAVMLNSLRTAIRETMYSIRDPEPRAS